MSLSGYAALWVMEAPGFKKQSTNLALHSSIFIIITNSFKSIQQNQRDHLHYISRSSSYLKKKKKMKIKTDAYISHNET